MTKSLLIDWINDFIFDVYRIKGFVNLEEGCHFIEVASGKLYIKPADKEVAISSLVILAPGNTPIRKTIQTSWNKKIKTPLVIE